MWIVAQTAGGAYREHTENAASTASNGMLGASDLQACQTEANTAGYHHSKSQESTGALGQDQHQTKIMKNANHKALQNLGQTGM